MSEFTCPHCGRLISAVKHETAYGVPWRPMHTLTDSSRRIGDVGQSAVPDFSEATRDTPARPPSDEADYKVPVKRTLTTGVLIGLPIAIGIGIITPEILFWKDVEWGCVIISTTLAISWLYFLSRSDKSLWIREKITNRDINQDGHIGKPAPIRIEYEDHEDGRDREVWADYVVPYKTRYAGAISFAKAIALQGESFAERSAASYGYTRDEWRDLRDMFIDNGWAIWNHPNSEQQGVSLLAAGKSILHRIAREGVPREQWVND